MSAYEETLFDDLLSFPVLDGEFGFTPWAATEPPPARPTDSSKSDAKPSSAAHEPERSGFSAEVDRRLRRKISNRESARRSRIRKQRHLEELRLEAHRLRSVNRGIVARLGTVRQYSLLFRRDNERLRSESAALRRRLAEIRRLVLVRFLSLPAPPAGDATYGGKPSGLGFAYLGLV